MEALSSLIFNTAGADPGFSKIGRGVGFQKKVIAWWGSRNICMTTYNIFHYLLYFFSLSDRGTSHLTFKCNLERPNCQ